MTSRKPREWLVVWVYGNKTLEVVEKIEEIQPLFQDELLEVCSPKVISPGLVFVRVVKCSDSLRAAIKRLDGVGGFLNIGSVETLQEREDCLGVQVLEDPGVRLGDCVAVRVGPLKGCLGTVVFETESGIVVRLSIFGRLIGVGFQLGEVEVYKKVLDDSVSG